MFGNSAFLFLIFVVTTIAFGEIYAAVSGLGTQAWLAAAMVNSLLALVILPFYLKNYLDRRVDKGFARGYKRLLPYLPGLFIVTGSLGIALVSSKFASSPQAGSDYSKLLTAVLGWSVWVPLVEEAVFRVGLGGLFRRIAGTMWGTYASVLLFSLVHTLPTFERLLSLEAGLTLGPIVLGLACEVLWLRTRSFGGIWFLHGACNLTTVIFSSLDPRWLTWLSPLYL